ncbi:restriction endonuclease [Rhodobacterales bacterium HKCCE2091]|nr:restriction endonuclease [Rhodobacterales bacterium HKCCE2091]
MSLDRLRAAGFDVMARNHAEAILSVDFAAEAGELVEALMAFRLAPAELIAGGGGEAPSTIRLRRALAGMGWRKHNFRIETTVDGAPRGLGTSHEIDHVRRAANGLLALEIEWNNKDPFFDRDLENFQRLHAQSVISAGLIVTRGQGMQAGLHRLVTAMIADRGIEDEEGFARVFGVKDRSARQREIVARAMGRGDSFAEAFSRQFVADKFGPSTTHWDKLADRVARGVGNPCPLVLIGLPATAIADAPVSDPEADLFSD